MCEHDEELEMARTGLSDVDVIRAYVSLLQQRRSPSLINLRLELSIGSYSTIAARLSQLCLVGPTGPYRRNKHSRRRGRPRSRTVY